MNKLIRQYDPSSPSGLNASSDNNPGAMGSGVSGSQGMGDADQESMATES